MKMRPESYSSIKTFRDCPRQYRANYVDKDLPYERSPAAERGERIHAGMERMIWDPDYAIPDEPAVTANAKRLLKALHLDRFERLERFLERGWQISVENELAITREFEAVDYHDKRAWLRGRLDLVMAPPQDGVKPVLMIDWKTGKTPGDILQLCVAAALLIPRYGTGKYTGIFAYLDQDRFDRHDLEGSGDHIAYVTEAMNMVEYCWTNDFWPAKVGGSGCRWCRMTERCSGELYPYMKPPAMGH